MNNTIEQLFTEIDKMSPQCGYSVNLFARNIIAGITSLNLNMPIEINNDILLLLGNMSRIAIIAHLQETGDAEGSAIIESGLTVLLIMLNEDIEDYNIQTLRDIPYQHIREWSNTAHE